MAIIFRRMFGALASKLTGARNASVLSDKLNLLLIQEMPFQSRSTLFDRLIKVLS